MVLPSRWNIHNLSRVVSNPRMLLGEFNRLGVELNKYLLKAMGPRHTISVMERDWDILLLLDACRSDVFEEVCWFDGELSTVESAGSESREFLQANFGGRQYHDTVYITTNPHAAELDIETFHAVQPLYESAWDSELKTVSPSRVVTALREANSTFPRKRLIAHFMQPHAPYIGGTTVPHSFANDPSETERTIWANLRYGLEEVSVDDVRTAYRENLQYVLEEIESVITDLDGKIVLSADHGELLGDRLKPLPVRGYGHPMNLPVSQLVEVPWFELPHSKRRLVQPDPPVSHERGVSDEQLTDKLAALGYY